MMDILLDKKLTLRMMICLITLHADNTIGDFQPKLTAEKEYGTLQFNCSTFKETIGLRVEILINGRTQFNLRFERKECYRKNDKCDYQDCSCNYTWFYWQQNATSDPLTVECRMRFDDDPRKEISAEIFYSGSVFINPNAITSTVIPTEIQRNTTNTTEIIKANSSIGIGIMVVIPSGIVLVILIIVVICVFKCRQLLPVFKDCEPIRNHNMGSSTECMESGCQCEPYMSPLKDEHIKEPQIRYRRTSSTSMEATETYLHPLIDNEHTTGNNDERDDDETSFQRSNDERDDDEVSFQSAQLDITTVDTGSSSKLENTPDKIGALSQLENTSQGSG